MDHLILVETRESMVEWVSVSRGVFLCNECAGIHRRPRNEAPRDEAPIVRSIRLDTWNTSHLEVHFTIFYSMEFGWDVTRNSIWCYLSVTRLYVVLMIA